LVARLSSGYKDEPAAIADLNLCRNVAILMLEDLGCHRPKDAIEDAVTSLIKHRCNYQKPLIATTSLTDPDSGAPARSALAKLEYRRTLAEQIGPAARSRLFEMCTVIRMPLIEDYRISHHRTL
jgi:DNA replication protein DnaC